MPESITIAEQCAAVELAALNLRGHVENLEHLVKRGKRPQAELDIPKARLPALEQAAKTMRWLLTNGGKIKAEYMGAENA